MAGERKLDLRPGLGQLSGNHLCSANAGEYKWEVNDHAAFGQRVTWFPNFDEGSDWRLESFTNLDTTLSEWLALRLG